MKDNLSKKVIAAAAGGAISAALVLIPAYEGVEYRPYRDVAGVLTVCYGHTGSDIQAGKIYTADECRALLHRDLDKIRRAVDPMITVPVDDTTRAAIYSFVYNVGPGAFSRSSMLRKLNSGDIAGACEEMKRWTFAGGRQWQGLINRRETENAVCRATL
ncbi:TPA: lysozyme [Morganella morganii]|uniref:Lysozyme n=1 Tax=Morganella morganii TaxID=582 RepID=A0A8I0U650_MORMO|nr:lysozyme [Morganella morganii]SGC86623.1 Phage-related lysozyme (muraminidase) [Mycobacterium tuberculosis]ELA7726928.1 lysozyme [Morganella morganii]MBA5821809.1 lysozyme [Morganella morganii]MBA5837717.1 lysozyme [Morganella morganii]MBC3998163.1 lysozyme [Morganella morganii]